MPKQFWETKNSLSTRTLKLNLFLIHQVSKSIWCPSVSTCTKRYKAVMERWTLYAYDTLFLSKSQMFLCHAVRSSEIVWVRKGGCHIWHVHIWKHRIPKHYSDTFCAMLVSTKWHHPWYWTNIPVSTLMAFEFAGVGLKLLCLCEPWIIRKT